MAHPPLSKHPNRAAPLSQDFPMFSAALYSRLAACSDLPRRLARYWHRQFALYSVQRGPKDLTQSQLHVGVFFAGQVILHVSLSALPQDTISHEFDPSARRTGVSLH